MTAAFDTAASDFERLGVHLWNPIGEHTVDQLQLVPGERVLDACCGTGASALPAALRVGPGGQVDAIDLSPPMIEGLRSAAAGMPHIAAVAADATTWPPSGYDAVVCVLGVFFFPDMAAGTEHLVSRARPGGRVAVTVWRSGAMMVAGRHLTAAVDRVLGREPTPPRPHPLATIDRPARFGSWLADRGLDNVTVSTHELHLDASPDMAWLLVTGSGFVAALTGLDEQEVADVRSTYWASLAAEGVQSFDATTLTGVGVRRGG